MKEEKSWDSAWRIACSKALGAEREEGREGCDLQRRSWRERRATEQLGKLQGSAPSFASLSRQTGLS